MRVLIVSPHPDDEAIGAGGAIVRHVAAGDQVQTVFLTSGEKGIPELQNDPDRVRETREAEAVQAAAVLGTLPPIFWRLPDGGVEVNESIVLRLRAICRLADRVYVTHQDDDHVDHRAAALLVKRAVDGLDPKPRVLTFEVWTPMRRPDVFVDISGQWAQKMAAIQSHLSQVRLVRFDLAAGSLNHYRGQLHNHHAGEYAEAFTRMKGTGEMKTGIVFLTYTPDMDHPRVAYARLCLTDLLKNLRPADDLHIHIADDGSPQEHRHSLQELAYALGFEATVTNSERGGYGHSYNLASQVVHSLCDYVMPIEDDWRLLKPLDVRPLIQAIDESQGLLRCIRLGYLGYSAALRGQLVSFADQSFLLFDHASEETYIWAGHPRLETVAFQRDLGAWPVGIGAGATETEVVHRAASRVGVAWPLDAGVNASQQWASMFAHVGDVHVGDNTLQALAE